MFRFTHVSVSASLASIVLCLTAVPTYAGYGGQCQQQTGKDFWKSPASDRVATPTLDDVKASFACKHLPRDWARRSGIAPFIGQELELVSGNKSCERNTSIEQGEEPVECVGYVKNQTILIGQNATFFTGAPSLKVTIPSAMSNGTEGLLRKFDGVPGSTLGEAGTTLIMALGSLERVGSPACGPDELLLSDEQFDMKVEANTCLTEGDGIAAESLATYTPAKGGYKILTKARIRLSVLEGDLLLFRRSDRIMKAQGDEMNEFLNAENCIYRRTGKPSNPSYQQAQIQQCR